MWLLLLAQIPPPQTENQQKAVCKSNKTFLIQKPCISRNNINN